MAEVLSDEEIKQILNAINGGDCDPDDLRLDRDIRKIKIYDYKRPDKFSKRQILTLSIMHEVFARLTNASLSGRLRSMVHVHVASIDQLTYEEFIRSIPTPTTLAIVEMKPLNGYTVLEMDPKITFSIIDRFCGGSGNVEKSMHELTDIEKSIMEDIVIHLLGNIREAWTQVVDLRPRLIKMETNPQYVQIVHPTEMVILVTLEIRVADVDGMINFCIPYCTIESIIEKLSPLYQHNTAPVSSVKPELNDRKDAPVRLYAEILRREYPLKEILGWNAETIILPLRSLPPDYCYLKIGDNRVWQCKILPDQKWFFKKIMIDKCAEKPCGTEGNDMQVDDANLLVREAVSKAPMMVSVELGSASKTVKEVLEMGEGTIIELDKVAGEPADIKVNGVLIARGEVIVVDENFGVRITEILSNTVQFPNLNTEEKT